jgi:hypothetical protein
LGALVISLCEKDRGKSFADFAEGFSAKCRGVGFAHKFTGMLHPISDHDSVQAGEAPQTNHSGSSLKSKYPVLRTYVPFSLDALWTSS